MDSWINERFAELFDAPADNDRQEKEIKLDVYDQLIFSAFGSFIERDKILDFPYSLFFYEVVKRFEKTKMEIEHQKKMLEKMKKR